MTVHAAPTAGLRAGRFARFDLPGVDTRTARGSTFVAAVLGIAFALRVVAGLALNLDHAGQVRGFPFYGEMADGLLSGRGMGWEFYQSLGYKFANRAPLYPLLLAALKLGFGAAQGPAIVVTQSLLGALGCLAPAWLGARWGGAVAGRVALVAAALWPYGVVIDSSLVEHVLYAPLAVLALLLVLAARDDGASPVRAAWAGAVAGLAVLTRVTFGLALPFLAFALLLRRGGVLRAALLTIAVAIVVAPWMIRNHAAVGRFTVGTDGGRALWLSNAPGTFDHYPAESIDRTEVELLVHLDAGRSRALRAAADDEVAQDALFRTMAFENIAARPLATAWGALRKLGALWSPVYNPDPIRVGAAHHVKTVVHFVTFGLLIGVALLGVAAVPTVRADLPVVLGLLAGFVVPAMIFWGQTRYLAPLHGVGLALGAAAFALRTTSRGT
jgi:hypothetical protein